MHFREFRFQECTEVVRYSLSVSAPGWTVAMLTQITIYAGGPRRVPSTPSDPPRGGGIGVRYTHAIPLFPCSQALVALPPWLSPNNDESVPENLRRGPKITTQVWEG
jgi:hypothetical protein